MSYRIEKEANGNSAIVIEFNDDVAIAPDPYSGTNYMLNTNIETKGEVSVGYPITTSTTSGVTLGDPIARSTRLFSYGTPGVPTSSPQSFAILDDDGHVFESTSISGTWTYLSTGVTLTSASNTDGVVYWLGYLFKTRSANIDYWNGSTWANGWQTTLTGNTKHFMYVGTDNVLYITNGNYLASITAPTPTAFDPTNSATYSFSITKLQLPVTDTAISLAEVGSGNSPQSTLLVGGVLNAIYPWDKVSSSYSLPIYVADSYIGLMVSANQNVFIFPGNISGRGRIYITNGSQADLYYKIPDYIFGEQDPYYQWGDAIFHRNNLIFGFFITKNSTASLLQSYPYVWAIDLDTKNFRAISTLTAGATNVANATCLISSMNLSTPGFGYIVGWSNNSSGPGIGYSGTTAGIGSGSILTDLIPIGTFLQKQTFTQVEYKLRSPLQSGESISITPFIDGASTATALSFQPTITTGVISGVASITFQGNQWVQFIISLTGNSATSGVRLRELRIR